MSFKRHSTTLMYEQAFAKRYKELINTKHGKSVAKFGAHEYALGYLRGEKLDGEARDAGGTAMDGGNNTGKARSAEPHAKGVLRKARVPATNN